jgi:leader peptidase (prepilin peptidase)/N-methyltransferase
LFAATVGVLGLLVGSFLNVVIHRLPIMMERDWRRQSQEILAADGGGATLQPDADQPHDTFNLVTPRSVCPSCGVPIKAWQNIPIVSYLALRGRCANCGNAIPARYPVVEAVTGLLSALVAGRFGYSPECVGALLLCWSLMALSVIDLDHQLLPDAITIPLLWLGLALSLTVEPGGGGFSFAGPRAAIIGALAGYLSLWSIYHAFKLLTGKEGMGYGDFKLYAALGAWLGWQMLPLIILLSAVVGAIIGIGLIVFKRHGTQTPIPFGPYLAAAGFVAMLWGPQIMTGYLRAVGM